MYDESIRMPLILSYPDQLPQGRRSERMVTNVDLARTFLDAAGVEPDPGMQGSSFFAPLRDGLPPQKDPAFYYRSGRTTTASTAPSRTTGSAPVATS